MRILIAPDSFKETLGAREAAEAIARGWLAARADDALDLCPMADGGEGTVEALVAATGGEIRSTRVVGPLGQPVQAQWGVLGDGTTAVIEMAAAAGLHRVPTDRRDPTRTTTYGVGELIRAALDTGRTRIILGIGGSATTDGGAGMAQALGVRFASAARGIAQPLTGGELHAINHVDRTTADSRLKTATITVACDVTNPLTGPDGAAHVYGPQKGATPGQVEQLDAGLTHLAALLPETDPTLAGMGAAGGLGFGLVAFCGAMLERGIELVINAVDFDRRAAAADLVVTGEGRIDAQSIQGKTCIGVAQRAAKYGTPTIALVGSRGDDADVCLARGLREIHTIVGGGVTIEQSLAAAADCLAALARRVAAGLGEGR